MIITMELECDRMLEITIDNEQVVSNQNLSIKEEMLTTSSTILNNCYPLSWETTKDYVNNFYYPKDYSLCKILKDNVLIFAGLVKNTGEISLKPSEPKYCSLQILDFKALLSEGETLDFVISNKTVIEAIEMIIEAIEDYGVVLGNINILNGNDIIGAYSTLNKTPYDVFQYLAEISQAKWTTRLVDENTIAIDFYDPSLMPKGENILYNTQWFIDNDIIDISFNYGTRDYRNKQVMISEQVYADIDYKEEILANGYTNTFELTNNIAQIKEIEVNGNIMSFATESDKDIGITANFYYEPGNNQIYADESENIIKQGSRILITYTPLVNGRQIIYNNDEIVRISNQINRKGVISRYEDRNDVLSSEELRKVGQSYIKYKGTAEINLTVQTKKELWNVGEVVYFDAPIEELKTDYMVKTKETNIIASIEDVFYTYQLSSNFNSENAINYFDNQRNKNTGNIAQGEFITRNVDIENQANIIFSDLQVEECSVNGNNQLDCPLNSPFVD